MKRKTPIAFIAMLALGFLLSVHAESVESFSNQTPTTDSQLMPHGKKTFDDNVLHKNLKTALAAYSNNLTIIVKSGVALLSGELGSNSDYDKVVTIAQSIPGVNDVNVDKLSVKDSKSPLLDSYLTAKVKGVLLRSDLLGKDISSWSISVETKDGVVFLSGSVSSAEEKKNVMAAIRSVRGIVKIDDKLSVGQEVPPQGEE